MGAPFLYIRAEMADCVRVARVSRLVACTCEQVVRVSSRVGLPSAWTARNVVAAERMDGV